MNDLSNIENYTQEFRFEVDDRQLVEQILNGKEEHLCLDDLINGFYLYLQKDNCEKLRTFRFDSKLQTWICVVASRYLLKKYEKELKENATKSAPIDRIKTFSGEDASERMITADLLEAINLIKEKRCQQVLLLGVQGYEPKEIGEQLGITTNNVYVIKSRAIEQLKNLIHE
jgi:RNA polymerase sigma factor (sigma-70 family)